jgi:hypothetical protein
MSGACAVEYRHIEGDASLDCQTMQQRKQPMLCKDMRRQVKREGRDLKNAPGLSNYTTTGRYYRLLLILM